MFDTSMLDEQKQAPDLTFGHTVRAATSWARTKSLESLKEAIPLPLEDNTIANYLSSGAWSTWQLAEYLIEHYPGRELLLSTWSLSEFSARKIISWLAEGRISSVSALLDHRAKNRHAEAFHMARQNFSCVRMTHVHAKVFVLAGQDPVMVLGSSNWTENPRIETGIVSNNPRLVEMNQQWIRNIIQTGSYELNT